MTEIMLPVRPKWCELIASGDKIIEARKTKPKCDTPFKVYIYCTKDKLALQEVSYEHCRYSTDKISNIKTSCRVLY